MRRKFLSRDFSPTRCLCYIRYVRYTRFRSDCPFSTEFGFVEATARGVQRNRATSHNDGVQILFRFVRRNVDFLFGARRDLRSHTLRGERETRLYCRASYARDMQRFLHRLCLVTYFYHYIPNRPNIVSRYSGSTRATARSRKSIVIIRETLLLRSTSARSRNPTCNWKKKRNIPVDNGKKINRNRESSISLSPNSEHTNLELFIYL